VNNLFLDLEYRESNLSSEEICAWVLAFMGAASERSNLPIGIYTSSNYLKEIGLHDTQLSSYMFWGADWGSQPSAYPWTSWDYWQYTGSAKVDWAVGDLCLDRRVRPSTQR